MAEKQTLGCCSEPPHHSQPCVLYLLPPSSVKVTPVVLFGERSDSRVFPEEILLSCLPGLFHTVMVLHGQTRVCLHQT